MFYCEKYLDNPEKIFIIEPEETQIVIDLDGYRDKEYFKIPETTCIAQVDYTKLLNHDVIDNINQLHTNKMRKEDGSYKIADYDYKELGIVWFQQDLGFQLSDSLLEELQNRIW